ncbi:hypothetical protein [Luteimonas sp. 3794]|uniref:hypothetical protein n=1 Tax=Luteimonas sp. 3794 TaxID=2817730 RepID=UPI00285E8D7C|nr:hypothetical protein [Luteimonas sp. 3794]MDR6993251.1 hypothetical protein [Luteimonas sp. 3794]
MSMWLAIGKSMVATLEVAADIGTIVASAIAVWIFITKRAEITSFIRTISTFVHQNSLAELRFKLEKLNDLNANDPASRAEAVSLFHDICGQIDGSPLLKPRLSNLCDRIRDGTGGRRFNEPLKRSLVSELRESLRHIDLSDYAENMREDV